MCPAAAQGALAIQTRESDPARHICAEFDDERTSQAVSCERTVLASLGGGCQLPVGAFAEAIENTLNVIAVVVSPDGARSLRAEGAGSRYRPEELGERIAADLLARGADKILSESK
jgi:hydroxymethylbilane synthase